MTERWKHCRRWGEKTSCQKGRENTKEEELRHQDGWYNNTQERRAGKMVEPGMERKTMDTIKNKKKNNMEGETAPWWRDRWQSEISRISRAWNKTWEVELKEQSCERTNKRNERELRFPSGRSRRGIYHQGYRCGATVGSSVSPSLSTHLPHPFSTQLLPSPCLPPSPCHPAVSLWACKTLQPDEAWWLDFQMERGGGVVGEFILDRHQGAPAESERLRECGRWWGAMVMYIGASGWGANHLWWLPWCSSGCSHEPFVQNKET